MSSIGKVFIVLNLVLSAAFVGWAANALGKTSDLTEQLAAEKAAKEEALKLKDDEIAKISVEKNGLADANRAALDQRDQFQLTSERLQGEFDDQKRRNDTLDGEIQKVQATLNDYKEMIAQMSAEKDRAIERAHEAERARDAAQDEAQQAELARRDAEEAQKNAETRIGDLEGEKVALEQKIKDSDTRLGGLIERTGVPVDEVMAVPVIQASVLRVRYDEKGGPGLVMLNVGKTKEVKPGYTFHVYRGTTYKGAVRVEDVQDSVCSAVIVGEREKGSIAQGDSASTKL
jgi:hypothetical protein